MKLIFKSQSGNRILFAWWGYMSSQAGPPKGIQVDFSAFCSLKRMSCSSLILKLKVDDSDDAVWWFYFILVGWCVLWWYVLFHSIWIFFASSIFLPSQFPVFLWILSHFSLNKAIKHFKFCFSMDVSKT